MNDRKEVVSLLEEKFERLATQRKAALDVPEDLGENILEVLVDANAEDDLPIIHGEASELPSAFLDFLNESVKDDHLQKK